MTTYYSPSIVTNGLVFYYDMANTAKSWKGQPTTNLCSSNGIHTNWNNSGTATWSSDDNYVPRVFPNVQVISMYKDTAGNSHIANGFANISSGLVYTVSTYVYIPSNSGTIAGSVPYMRTFPANTSRGALLYEGSSDWNTWPRDRWIRISNSFTNSAGDTSMYISCYLDNTGNKIYMTAPMVEQKSVLSSYVEINSTRSTTQALLDLTGRNTITANSLTYNVNSTFSFNGSVDYLTLSSNIFNSSLPNFTISSWFNKNSNGILIGNHYHNSTWESIWFSTTQFIVNGASNNTTNRQILSFTEPSNGLWQNLTAVNNSSQGFMKIYLNGIEIATRTATVIPWNSSILPTIGAQRLVTDNSLVSPINGQISIMKVYNKSLSASEVLQNFNALRGRYGI